MDALILKLRFQLHQPNKIPDSILSRLSLCTRPVYSCLPKSEMRSFLVIDKRMIINIWRSVSPLFRSFYFAMSVDFASCLLVSCLLSFTFSMCCPLSVFHFCFCELKTYWKCNYFATCRRNETSSAERRRREHTCSNQLSGQLLGLLVVELTSLTPINYIVLWLSGKIT